MTGARAHTPAPAVSSRVIELRHQSWLDDTPWRPRRVVRRDAPYAFTHSAITLAVVARVARDDHVGVVVGAALAAGYDVVYGRRVALAASRAEVVHLEMRHAAIAAAQRGARGAKEGLVELQLRPLLAVLGRVGPAGSLEWARHAWRNFMPLARVEGGARARRLRHSLGVGVSGHPRVAPMSRAALLALAVVAAQLSAPAHAHAGDPAGTILELASLRIKPGISTHARGGGPDSAAKSLLPLLEFVSSQPGVVPAETPVYFLATAGMRLLEPALQQGVLGAVERLLADSHFHGANARILSGEEEALFDWLTVNTALGLLGGEHGLTASVADLGGASTQLAFAVQPDSVPRPDQLTPFGGAHVLGVSRLGLGINEALDALLRGPSQGEAGSCLAPGTRAHNANGDEILGTGDYFGCRAAIRILLTEYEGVRHGERPAPPTLPSEGQWPVYLLDNFPKGAAILLKLSEIPAEQSLTLAELEHLGLQVVSYYN
ncbi:nucleoside phosphatase family-domain-containing protein [Pavlovales sp. CCMP2436]|nr:nucleoside phosphatase family-domain-containing protein [Pavlovales sp. CCMP2436]